MILLLSWCLPCISYELLYILLLIIHWAMEDVEITFIEHNKYSSSAVLDLGTRWSIIRWRLKVYTIISANPRLLKSFFLVSEPANTWMQPYENKPGPYIQLLVNISMWAFWWRICLFGILWKQTGRKVLAQPGIANQALHNRNPVWQ